MGIFSHPCSCPWTSRLSSGSPALLPCSANQGARRRIRSQHAQPTCLLVLRAGVKRLQKLGMVSAVPGMSALDMNSAEDAVVNHTREVVPGMVICGMEARPRNSTSSVVLKHMADAQAARARGRWLLQHCGNATGYCSTSASYAPLHYINTL